MTKVYTVHGTPTTGGGTVIANNPFIIEGKPLACVGDMATCTIPSHPPIVTILGPGDTSMIVFGRPASLNGDLLSCGCRVLMSQSRMIRGDRGNESTKESGASKTSLADSVKTKLGKITRITLLDSITLQHTQKDVMNPHWEFNLATTIKDGQFGSFRPSAYKIGQQIKAKLEVEYDNPKIGDVLIGLSDDKTLRLEGSVKSISGKQAEIEVRSDVQQSIACFDKDFTWELNNSVNLGVTRLEVYVLHDTPIPLPSGGGSSNSWVEVLRFCFRKVKISGNSKVKSLSDISSYCFSMGLKYDVLTGAPSYLKGSIYKLTNYINLQGTKTVNCVDQACALTAIVGMVGIESAAIIQEPFGYLNPINLIGYGLCNNPFFKSNNTDQIYKEGVSIGEQTAFGMHTFVTSNEVFSDSPSGFIFDSCSGPACYVPVQKYYDDAIDYQTGVKKENLPEDFTATYALAKYVNWLSGVRLV